MTNRDRVPLSDLVEQFHHSNEATNLSARTIRWYDEILQAFLRWLDEQGLEPVLGSFTLETAEEYIRHLNTRGNRHTGRDLSCHTVDAHVRALKVFAGFLHDRGKAEVNVLDRLRRPRVRTPRIDVLTDGEALQLLAACIAAHVNHHGPGLATPSDVSPHDCSPFASVWSARSGLDCGAPRNTGLTAVRQKLVEGIQLRWWEVLAIEMVLEEIAADFDGEDPALPKQRQALADIKDRLAELRERTQKYAGSFKLGEPDDELPSMVRGVMRQQKEGYE